MLLSIWGWAQTTPTLTRGPYLQIGTPTGIVVRWRTDLATASRVNYGTDPANLTQQVDSTALTTEHEVTLTGLSPATRYYYAIGDGATILAGGVEYFFITAPVVGTRKKTRFWILGDSGHNNSVQQAVKNAYFAFTDTVHTDFWVMLGDNAYSSGTDAQYQSAVFDAFPTMLRKSVLWPAFGNHDAGSASSTTQTGVFYDIFTLPKNGEAGGVASGTEAYYAFDFANIHFICLNSHDIDRSTTGPMLTWLQSDLAANTADWTIAFWHHPPYTKGSHNSDTEIRLIEMRQNALPILETGGVDMIFTGHSHSYERSYLLDGHYGSSGTLTGSMILDGGDGRENGNGAYTKPALGPIAHQGAVYVVAGSSAQTSGGSLNHPAMFISWNVPGSVVVDIDSNRADLVFLSSAGQQLDYFTMLKGSGDPPLRVSISTFYGKATEGEIRLTWVTQSEVNNRGFEIFRATESAGPYELIASYRTHPSLEGAGNSSAPVTYHFTDRFLVNGQIYWYRLESVDALGERESFGPIRVEPLPPHTIDIDPDNVPRRIALFPAYPNPFNAVTTLRIDLPDNGRGSHRLRLEVFDLHGRRVATLLDGNYAPGSYAVIWDATDARGQPVASGLYIYRMVTENFVQSRRMLLVR
ncbi:MAG: T9SS C-terminal target domain-containing protein [Calditrichaeota bacterium]|nr:MAG: T9SS C-terminal target domain-containing protein [Calditrichota bacterium]